MVQVDENEARRLLDSAASGDMAAWAQLLTAHVDRLARMISLRLDRRLRGRIDPEDVIQEIYAEAWRHLSDFRANSKLPFYLWIRGLARHKLLELHRQHLQTKMRDARREVGVRAPAHDESASVLGDILLDSHTSPSNAAVREELKTRLSDALSSMDDIDREVIVLRHFEHLSPPETAKVLGIQEKAAGMRYVRAMKRLREILDELPGGLSGFRL